MTPPRTTTGEERDMEPLAKSAERIMEKSQKGLKLAEVLQLRLIGGERQRRKGELYQTTWGKKTAYGLYETVVELLK